MKKNNNALQKNSFLLKLKSWLFNLVHKNKKQEIVESISESEILIEKKIPFSELREVNERHKYLLDLQHKFENNEIAEEDINDEDRTDLEKLYNEQISNIKREIVMYEKKMNV